MTTKLWHKVATAALVASTSALTGSALAEPSAAIEGAPATIAESHPLAARPAATQTQAGRTDAQRYAERERAAPQLANFRGGDTIVIGASAVALILAIVLIIVLI